MTRYAVYALPGALGDADAPEALRLRAAAEEWYAREEFRDLTAGARRYGFHATLKAPFRLADGTTEAGLRSAADAFAAERAPVTIAAPRVEALGSFRALRPGGDESAIDALAADAVRAFDGFRAAPSPAETARRRPDRMTPRQRELFERWGYPYVLDEFRFHLTLTDPVPVDRAARVDAALADEFAGVAGADVPLLSVALFVEPEPGAPFEVHSVHPFPRPQESRR
ncbi:DUF1045 domain-containing protein [Microbacterium marinilacus]|uniref:DUF1045 domain-containing protein n=1 Tax=Microbacterium marinilacus TaxID=415209 RepID=A0ABP7B5Y1_9MICO|nr:DUF1045 domain-containing protein [Microbacterium marinilacus]MBY0687757.1 DUF1045 domain-containing protein [Microbacterium marinilacus]